MASTQSEYSRLDPSCCPDGINLEIFTSALLLKSLSISDSPHDLEHVTPIMKNYIHGNGLWLNWYPKGSSDYHLGIDLKEDYYKVMNLLKDRFYDTRFMYDHDIVDSIVQIMISSSSYPKARRYCL